jgi:hypothetical protein
MTQKYAMKWHIIPYRWWRGIGSTEIGTMSAKTIEFAPFRAKPGVDESTMLALSNRLEGEFLAQQPGYIRRELLKAEDGSFVDLVWWESPAAAEAAMTKVAESEVCAAYFAAMELASAAEAGVSLYRQVRDYSG